MLKNLEASSVNLDGVDASLFGKALAELVESARKTDDGDRNDAHRQAHDNFYAKVGFGVKVHMTTTKTADGTVLVVDPETGRPSFDSLMVSALILKREYHEAGEKEPTKSRDLTLVKQRIQKVVNETFGTFVTLKLTKDNFESLSIGGTVEAPADIYED